MVHPSLAKKVGSEEGSEGVDHLDASGPQVSESAPPLIQSSQLRMADASSGKRSTL